MKNNKFTCYFLLVLFILCIKPSSAFTSEVHPVKIACVGNSITYGANILNRENNSYPAQLQNLLGDDFEVKNFGVSGRTLLTNGDLPYTNTNEYTEALEYGADIVFIMLGTNDSKSQNREYLNEFVGDYKLLINSFKDKNEDARIMLLLPLSSFIADSAAIWDPVIVQQVIPKIQQVAFDLDVEVIDLYHLFVDQPNLMPDKIHPSSLGATVIAQRAYEAVKMEFVLYDLQEVLEIKNAKHANFYGFEQLDFINDEVEYKVVKPKKVLADKPWVWRARFWGHEPQTDIALLERGFHIVYCDVSDLYGNAEAVGRWNRCYSLMINAGLDAKPALEGMSRGGLIIYNWASENLDKVSCIYADAPVLDAKSWPGGLGKGIGSTQDWNNLKQKYGIATDSIPLNFRGWPIHKSELFAKSTIPLLHICGVADDVVPVAENTELFAKNIRDNGGDITTIYKPDVGHHPHSLKNPSVIVDFILRATGHKVNFAAIEAPGSEYRSAAGWKPGKGWWEQAHQIDSLCEVLEDIDLLLIGNSITQGWGGARDWVTGRPGESVADEYFADLKWMGAGISGDQTQHVSWRLKNGHYNQCQPKVVVLSIGVNNFSNNSAFEIVEGLEKVLLNAEETFPDAKILFFGPLPTGLNENSEQRIKYKMIHEALAKFNYSYNVSYYNLEELFVDENGALKESLYSDDGIHLKEDGYRVWAAFICNEI